MTTENDGQQIVLEWRRKQDRRLSMAGHVSAAMKLMENNPTDFEGLLWDDVYNRLVEADRRANLIIGARIQPIPQVKRTGSRHSEHQQ